MSSSITTFIATALVLFTLGQALANPAKLASQTATEATMGAATPAGRQG